MTDTSSLAGRVAAVLTDPDGSHRRRGIELAVDHALSLPLQRLVDVDPFAEVIADALAEPLWVALVERHGRGIWTRLTERVGRTGEVVGDLVSAETRGHIEAIVLSLKPPQAAWIARGIDAGAVRRLVAPIVQDTLLAFAKKLPLPGVGPGGGSEASRMIGGIAGRIAKSVGESADRIADVGKVVMGGMEKKLAAIARDFSHQAVAEIRDALRARLASDEGRAILAELEKGVLAELYRTPVAEVLADVESFPVADAFALVDPIARHNAAREQIRTALREELGAILAVEAERTVGDLLDEIGVRAPVRQHVVTVLDAEARAYFARADVTAWIAEVLAAAGAKG